MASVDDINGFEAALQDELDRIDDHTDADRPHVRRFVRKQDGRVKTSTIVNYLRHLRTVATYVDGPLVALTEDAFDQLIFELRNRADIGRRDPSGYSDSTVRIYQITLRKYLRLADRHVDRDLSWADDVELVTADSTGVTADDMLRDDDIVALTDAADNLRDIALIEFLADTGARLALAASLRVGDVDLEGDRATYTPNPNATGLKGADIVAYPIIDALASLRTYLNSTHPRADDDGAALFHRRPGHGRTLDPDGDGALTPQSIRRRLRKAADAAGIDKPVNPHNFRHSAVTRMRREGYDRSTIEHRVHWTVDSRMWQTYEHIGADEHNSSIWEQAGVGDATDEGESAERKRCGNCRTTAARWAQWCPQCGEGLTPDARERARQATAEGSELLVELDGERLQLPAADIVRALATGAVQPAADDHD